MEGLSSRPRNIGVSQSASILYGDWGTSKAYVIGLAFAIAGYSSIWLILPICVLMALVGFNYITICKFSPSGGGVYTSARKHSEVLALIAAFFLIADYVITAAISSLSCFEYLGVEHPALWAIASIGFIASVNYFGPKHSGNLATLVGLATVVVVVILGLLCLPFIGDAIRATKPLEGDFFKNWNSLVGMIVALSGIEAIANTTGVMKLDPGSSESNPSVHQTSKKAILLVMAEVCFFTAFFALMVNAIPNLVLKGGNIETMDHVMIRDEMLRYMGEYFSSHLPLVKWIAPFIGQAIGVSFAILLLSAVNTAVVALVSLLFVMSRDGEMPSMFQKLTTFGVPKYPLVLASLAPIGVLLVFSDVAELANLYAVGFVGAIAVNLAVNGYDRTIPMKFWERALMLFTCVIVVLIEISLFVDKPDARRFAFSVMTIGLILRMLVVEHRQKQWADKKVKLRHASLFTGDTRTPLHQGAMLCAVLTVGKTLKFALQEAKENHQPLYILFIREQKVITEEDRHRIWLDDDKACEIFDYAKDQAKEVNMKFFYRVSDSPVSTIVEMAKELQVSRVILGRPRYSQMLQLIRGNIAQEVSEVLPKEIDLLVIC